jgi:pimeloyl-ACP methyl ester carboxylesterase
MFTARLIPSEGVGEEALARNPALAPPIKPALALSLRQSPEWEPETFGGRPLFTKWNDYMAMASRVVGRFFDQFRLDHFEYMHPVRLQRGTPVRLRKIYPVKVAYTDWGPRDAPVLICCGGVANTAMRFNYLASDLSNAFRVICMDWVGRGRSAWMAHESDYSIQTCAEQLRQMIEHLGVKSVTVLGSSLGGSVAIELAARHPKLVDRVILNDIGPHIPKARRKRRAETLARHYVFRDPAELFRKIGASQKNDGPVSDDVRFNLTFHQTRWSELEGGRVYRHDVRAMQAYQRDAAESLDQWKLWDRIRCPVLLIHGLRSDALLAPTIERMARAHAVKIMYVPDTGHTPVLADRNQIWFIREWLNENDHVAREWSVLHAPLREPFPGAQVPFAPVSALR